MTVTETSPASSEAGNSMPLPGTIPHFEYISELQTPLSLNHDQLQAWLIDNFVAESFARAIRRHREEPISSFSSDASIDSRFMEARPPRLPIWRGTVSSLCDQNLLTIHGRPHPNESEAYNYTYDVALPLTHEFGLDVNRPLDATYKRGSLKNFKLHDVWAYNSYGDPAFKPDGNAPFVYAIQEAAYDLSRLLRHENGEVI